MRSEIAASATAVNVDHSRSERSPMSNLHALLFDTELKGKLLRRQHSTAMDPCLQDARQRADSCAKNYRRF
jgi:hypothetical protein